MDGESSGVFDIKTRYVTVTKKIGGRADTIQEERDSLSQAGAAKRSPKPLVTI